MSAWVSSLTIEFPSKTMPGISLPVWDDRDRLTVTGMCHCAVLDGQWQEHPQLLCSPLGTFGFSAKATNVFFSLCIFPFLVVLLFVLVTIVCWAEVTWESGVQVLFGFYISCPANYLLIIKIRKNSWGMSIGCFCLFVCVDEMWEIRNCDHTSHWNKIVFCAGHRRSHVLGIRPSCTLPCVCLSCRAYKQANIHHLYHRIGSISQVSGQK